MLLIIFLQSIFPIKNKAYSKKISFKKQGNLSALKFNLADFFFWHLELLFSSVELIFYDEKLTQLIMTCEIKGAKRLIRLIF